MSRPPCSGTDMNPTLCVRTAAADPEFALDEALAAFSATAAREQWLIVDFTLRQYWLEDQPGLDLIGFYHLKKSETGGALIEAGVVVRDAAIEARLEAELLDVGALLDALAIPRFALDRAALLAPVAIPKPWGQEIWYTGIERRGLAGAVGANGRSVPLPWLLALAPRRLCGDAGRRLILLKILDPLPDAVYGDLYFELHREKQEVYVVTEVHRDAWPDGCGAIRFGFDPDLRRSYADDRRFLEAYAAAVRDYRQVRRTIDATLDEYRAQEGISVNEPVPAPTLRGWLQRVPEHLQRLEAEKREAMEQFTGLLPLRVGDVLKVPCWVPHSLQHGVRTVEFQTPVYERLILSFAQKVLTQADWDTEEALDVLQLDAPAPQPWDVTAEGPGWVEERIVQFDDFEVRRVTLQAGVSRILDAPERYALCMVIGAGLVFDGAALAGDQAVLVPGCWRGGVIANPAPEARRFLWALPSGEH